jgi:hypothetical protein
MTVPRGKGETLVIIPSFLTQHLLLLSSTLVEAYSEMITAMTNIGQDHIDLADALNSQVVDVLKTVERKSENLAKKVGFCSAWCFSHEVMAFVRKCNSFTSSFLIGIKYSQSASRLEALTISDSFPRSNRIRQSKQKVKSSNSQPIRGSHQGTSMMKNAEKWRRTARSKFSLVSPV